MDPSGNIPDVKKIVELGLSMVPEVGGVLAWLCDLIWPENQPDPIVELKKYVDAMMQQALEEVKVELVEQSFRHLKADLEAVRHANSVPDRAEAVKNLYYKSGEVEEDFETYYNYQPWNTLPYLVAFGTIRLQCLRDRVLHYPELYGATNDKPQDTKQELKDKIVLFKGWVENARATALQWRNVINIEHIPAGRPWIGEGPFPMAQPGSSQAWKVTDARDTRFTVQFSQEFQTNRYADNCRWDIAKSSDGFASRLDRLIDAYRYWDFMDPDTPYQPTPGPFYTYTRMGGGLDPGGVGFNHELCYKQNGPMTNLNFWWDAGALKGLQVWYGGVDSGLIGMTTRDGSSYGFGSGVEVISVLGGHAGNYVERFYYNTNIRKAHGLGVMGSAGSAGDIVWQPEFHNSVQAGDTRVAYFAGINAPSLGRITELNVAWVKTVKNTAHLAQ